MANKRCRALFKIQDIDIAKMKVPSGETFAPGQIVKLETLDTNITDNLEVYSPTPVSDYTADNLCIIINQEFETTSDGRRITGQPDVSQYTYANEENLIAVRLTKNMKFFISDDCLDNTGVVIPADGVYLIPQNGDYDLATSATLSSAATGLIIDEYTNEWVGRTSVDGSVCRVVAGY